MSIKFKDLTGLGEIMPQGGLATLYIVDFSRFYKVGMTQKSVANRLLNYPPWKLVKSWELDTAIVRWLEKEVVYTYHNYTPYSWGAKYPGASECFRTKNIEGVIKFIEQRVEGKDNNIDFYISKLPDGTFQKSLRTYEGTPIFVRSVPYLSYS